MEMLTYQQETALFRLNNDLTKNDSESDYFELLDLFRQLEIMGFVSFSNTGDDTHKYYVIKTPKGQGYTYNWLISEFR